MQPIERFHNACFQKPVDRAPVWMMRQAGRYLPEYRDIRKTHNTLAMMKSPEIACEITLQPIRRLGVDAAILYSDILIIAEAMGPKLEFVRDVGPTFTPAIQNEDQINSLNSKSAHESCGFVYETITRIKKEIPTTPLLGFAGAPFTVATYMVGGDGSHDGNRLKKLALSDEKIFHVLMEKITEATIAYLKEQKKAGIHAFQLFDTWAGSLDQTHFQKWCLPYHQRIFRELKSHECPSILYIKGGSHLFDDMLQSGSDVISLDWRLSLKEAHERAQGRVALQGNLDPAFLYAPQDVLKIKIQEMLNSIDTKKGYVANLGHGIMPDVPVENADFFVKMVQS